MLLAADPPRRHLMKINNSNEPIRLDNRSAAKAAKPAATERPSAEVSISSVAAKLSSMETQFAAGADFDHAKVEALKDAIREGRFSVNAEVVADKLISSALELVGKKPS